MAESKQLELGTDEIKINNDSKNEEKEDECNKETIKILFLDIDGVMNGSIAEDLLQDNIGDDDTQVTLFWNDPNSKQLFKSHRVDKLKQILAKTDCKIVLSTAWRKSNNSKKEIKDEFIKNGIKWNDIYIGDTPIKDNYFTDINKSYGMCQRTYEINFYLESIKSKYIVKSWCAVDDMSLDYGKQEKQIMCGHFVQTDGCLGLTDKDMINIINILNK
eukprot:338550_1